MPYPNTFMPQQPFAPYQPQGYMTAGTSPMLMQQQQPQQQPIHGFVYVTGLEGAKAYQMPPNSEMPLFDSGGDVMYIKTTDGAGFPTIKICDVSEKADASTVPASSYVTHDELQRIYSDLTMQVEQMKGVLYGAVPATPDVAAAAEQPAVTNAKHSANDGR